MSVELLDVSLTGARIRLPDCLLESEMPQAGETMVLQWDRFEKLGQLVWRDGALGGLALEESVAPAEIIATRDLQDDYVAKGGADRVSAVFAREWVQGTRR